MWIALSICLTASPTAPWHCASSRAGLPLGQGCCNTCFSYLQHWMNHLQPMQPCLGWFCCCCFCRVGARNPSAILHCSRQVNRWPRSSAPSWCRHLRRLRKIITQAEWAPSLFQNTQGRVVSTLGCAEQQSPPYPTEVKCISATQKPQSHFHCQPLVSSLWKRTKAALGGWEPPRILASVRPLPSLEDRIYPN